MYTKKVYSNISYNREKVETTYIQKDRNLEGEYLDSS